MATNDDLDKIKKVLADSRAAEMEFSDDESQGVMAEDIGVAVSNGGPNISTTVDMSTLSSLWSSSITSCGSTLTTGYNGTTYKINGPITSPSLWSTIGTGSPLTTGQQDSTLKVKGDAEFGGDIKWQGRSMKTLFESIEDRLAILQPDPEKLEHFEALRKAYEHYKTLEALCTVPKKEDK
jgi:hypothetical protein